MKLENITGNRYGMLTVLKRQDTDGIDQITWLCLCDCGREKVVRGISLRKGITKSCGCLRTKTITDFNTTHGGRNLAEYGIWQHMLNRCRNKNVPEYRLYGGKGISVCDRWQDFKNFIDDMGSRPSKNHSIDRKNVDGNYEPSNCRWATSKEQQRNRTNNVLYTYRGITASLAELCDLHGLKYKTVHRRLATGFDIESAFSKKRLPRRALNQTIRNVFRDIDS